MWIAHTIVKQTENFCVRQLMKKIESHPHRETLQTDLQNNVYHPFSDDSKAMIREMDNEESVESCETIPKVQCSQCLRAFWLKPWLKVQFCPFCILHLDLVVYVCKTRAIDSCHSHAEASVWQVGRLNRFRFRWTHSRVSIGIR